MSDPLHPLRLEFPLPRPLTGVLLGNGVQGLMIWGDRTLNITVSRAGFWDHRGGGQLNSGVTYRQLRRWLEAGDEAAIQAAFAGPPKPENEPKRPHQIGGGRLELRFGHELVPHHAELDYARGTIHVELVDDAGRRETVTIRQAVDNEVAWVEMPGHLAETLEVEQIPAWQFLKDQLKPLGVEPPMVCSPSNWATPHCMGTMTQTLPADPALAIAWRKQAGGLVLATALSESSDDDPTPLAIERLAHERSARLAETEAWWERFWTQAPRVDLPDPVLERMYRYGLFRLAGATMPTTPQPLPAGLQGPFMEEVKLPAWSNDYHFNINVQMIHWPLLHAGLTDHLNPMWKMIRRWMETMRQRGQAFFEAGDALMLPHATDDRCAVVGAFWSGTIDHGCCAWMAQLALLHWRYSGERQVLRDIAWPLLVGAFEGFWAMAEPIEDDAGQGRLSLPISVSPEYNGSRMDACGRDSSFQLAAWHMVSELLPQTAEALDEPIDPRWAEVREKLPRFAPIPIEEQPSSSGPPMRVLEGTAATPHRIGLWRGQDLDEPHRHHSHLAGVYPFNVIDPFDPELEPAVTASYSHWTAKGAGTWSAWSMPWASILCARREYANAAVAWLHWLDRAFCNEGLNTPHSGSRGATTMCFDSPEQAANRQAKDHVDASETMELDAALGCVTAVAELLVQCRRDAIHVLPALPLDWRNLSFDRVRTEGGFEIGATVRRGRRSEIRVHSPRGGRMILAHHLGDRVLLDGQLVDGQRLDLQTTPGQTLRLTPVEDDVLSLEQALP